MGHEDTGVVPSNMAKACPTPQAFRAVAGTVVYLTLLFFLTFLSRLIFSPLIPAIGEDIELTSGQAGSVFFVGSFGVLAGSISAGLVSSRLNHRRTLLVSLLGMAVVLVLLSTVDSVWGLRAAMIVMAFFAGLHLPSSLATITATVREQDWPRALSIQQLGPPLGLVGAPLVAVGLSHWFSWQTTFLWVAGLVVLLDLGFLLFFGGIGAFPGDPPSPRYLGPLAHTRSFWLMIFLFALGMGAQVGVYTMLPLYLSEERGMTVSSANTLLGLANIPPLAMVFVSGYVTGRIGPKRTMALFLFLTGVAAILVGSLSGPGLTVAIFLLPAFAVCFFPPAFAALSRIVQPTMRSLAAALGPSTAFIIGGGLLPQALGYMGQAYSFSLGIIITGVVIAVGSGAALLVYLLKELEPGC
jgi:NNP family nitrate/nitrite transporter-like MFS transporter